MIIDSAPGHNEEEKSHVILEERKKKKRKLSTHDNDEKDYEKLPRTKLEWLEQARQATRLPIVLPSGDTVVPASSVTNSSLKGRSTVTFSKDLTKEDDKNEPSSTSISKKQKKRIEILTQEKNLKSNKSKKPEDEITKIYNSLKTTQAKLAVIAKTSEILMSEPEKNLNYFELLYKLAAAVPQRFEELPRKIRNQLVCTVSLISIGAVLKNCLPGYKLHTANNNTLQDVQEIESHTKKGALKKQSNQVLKQQQFETGLLGYYERYLQLLQRRLPYQPEVITPIICELLLTAPVFNYSNELLNLCVLLACFTPNMISNTKNQERYYHEDSIELATFIKQRATDCLLELIQCDPTLDLAVELSRIVAKLGQSSVKHFKDTSKAKFLGTSSFNKVVLHGNLLHILSKIDFQEKEAAVKRESSLRGISETENLTKELARDIHMSSIYGDIKKFETAQTEILNHIFSTVLRVFRTPNHFPSDTLKAAIHLLSSASYIANDTLIAEIASELRRLVLEEKSRLTGTDLLHVVMEMIKLAKNGNKSGIHVDTSWIIESFCDALYGALPLLISKPDATPSICLPSYSIFNNGWKKNSHVSELQPTDNSQFLNELLNTAELLLTNSNILGVNTATVVVPQGLLRFTQALFTIAIHCADPLCRIKLFDLIISTIQKIPALKSIMDFERPVIHGEEYDVSFYWMNELLDSWGHGCYLISNAAITKKLRAFGDI